MSYPIASGVTVSTAAYTKTSNLITNRNQFLPKGRLQVFALGSAIGMNMTINIGGVAIADDLPIVPFGATGGLNVQSHQVIDQVVAGGVAEFFLRNTTVGALTTDYLVLFTPMK